jgi:signal transduction histidine kinase
MNHKGNPETVGEATGRVAHDFNNLLLAILGFATLLNEQADNEDTVRCTAEILEASQRALVLTERLREISEQTAAIPLVCASPDVDHGEVYPRE